MTKKGTKKILLKYFYKEKGKYYPSYISDCDKWTEMFDELFGD